MLLASHPDISGAVDARVKVTLPALIRLNLAVGRLNLRRSGIRAALGGDYVSAFKGRGMEFDETRPYMPGDDVRNLDWRVTARTGKAHTKLFREERERPVFLSVDARAAMFFATRGAFKFVQAAHLAALAAWSALRQSDRVGGQLFGANGSMEFKPEHGRKAVMHFLQQLVDVEAPPPAENSGAGIDEALARLARHARPGSLVLVLSDFRGLTPLGEASLIRLHRHCEVALLSIDDPLERQIPEHGRYRFSDGRRELSLASSRQLAEAHSAHYAARLAAVTRLARGCGMRHAVCLTTDDPFTILRNTLRTHRSEV